MDYLQELNELRKELKFVLRREYIEELIALQELLNHSYVERYCDIAEQSEYGTNCGYAAKCKDLFIKMKEHDISEKIKSIYETFIKER